MNPEIFSNLGPKYKTPRPIQSAILSNLERDQPRIAMVEAPVGIGKSAVAVAYGDILTPSDVETIDQSVILAATISLQEQYRDDFEGMRLVKGRGNFPCTLNGLTAADGWCQSHPKERCDSPYYAQREVAQASRRVVANYALYLNEMAYTKGFLGRDETRPLLLVCDEAHQLLNQLTEFETVRLSTKAADKLGLVVLGEGWATIGDAIAWCNENRQVIRERMSDAVTRGDPLARDWIAMDRNVRAWRSLGDDYLPLETGQEIKAAPLWPTRTARTLFNSAEHFLLMSATLYGGHLLGQLLGLENSEYEYYASPSPFDPRRWPVHVRPVASLSYRASDDEWNRMAQEIHRYMHEYRNTRGVIHVTAARQLNRLLHSTEGCESCRMRLIRPKGSDTRRGKTRAELLREFRSAGPDTWLAHYCLDPSTRILYADGSWRLLRDAKEGDELIGFDETPPDEGKWRKLRRTTITSIGPEDVDTYRIQTDQGVTHASANHAWLMAYPRKGWQKTQDLKPGHKIRFLGQWDYDSAPYLGGLLDGEGFLRQAELSGGGVGFGQNPGLVLDAYRFHLEAQGIHYTEHTGHASVQVIMVSRLPDRLKLLGIAPSLRLRQRYSDLWEGKRAASPYYATVLEVTSVGNRRLIGLETSTSTLFADGMFSHNSVGEGESFDDDSARIQLIAKIPFPDLSSPLMRLRKEEPGIGKTYYAALTAGRVAQTAGRIMRHSKDFGETIILDGAFRNLYRYNKSLFPGWFHDILD
ncbi:hypothetical protein LCGC14_0657700 [marine sediment metagenome]|uniref:Helicase ATP-binding domain-containing protein n=1 Tax=marine sediment metagenome TaxID=412755 RepID=A0A0F9TG66_9ZZZZ